MEYMVSSSSRVFSGNRMFFAIALASICMSSTLALASDPVIEGWQHPPNGDKNIGRTQIVVTGSVGAGRYTGVSTNKINAWIVVDGHAPKRANRPLGATIEIEDKRLDIPSPTGLATYKVRFNYIRPLSEHTENQRLRPVALCNDRLADLSGNRRAEFLKNGDRFWLNRAYKVALSSGWLVNGKKKGAFTDPPSDQTWTNETQIGVSVYCKPINPNAGTTRVNPGNQSDAKRTNPKKLPRVKTARLDIAPYQVETVGAFQCPTKLRLKGFLETNKRMRGSVIFVGPVWLSPKKDFNFDGASTLNHIATYDLKWDGGLDQLATQANTPSRQDLSFKFNVVNGKGKLVKSVARDIRVTCQ